MTSRKIVLTAPVSEISQYDKAKPLERPDAFIAFACTFPHKLFWKFLERSFVPDDNPDNTTRYAPYGLRKLEAILGNHFGEENIAVCHPYNLDKFVGNETKVVGISTMDPCGLAYVSTTYNSIIGFGGESIDAYAFKQLMNSHVLKQYSPKIVVGGQGAWQIKHAKQQQEFGIDVIVDGSSEKGIVDVFSKLIDNKPVSHYVETGIDKDYSKIPLIKNAAVFGSVEITRGCGRGCEFCTPTMMRKHSFPVGHIMGEVEANVKNGSKMIFTITEDMFLYESDPGFIPNKKAISTLYNTIGNHPGVEYIGLSHASLAPIIYDSSILSELDVLVEKSGRTLGGKKFATVEVGVETGSINIMKKRMKNKAKPYSVDEWPQLVQQGVGIMNDHKWYPLCTFITGWPGETEDDRLATQELLDDLDDSKYLCVPNVFIPLEKTPLGKERRVDLNYLTESQWDIIASAWKHNIKIWEAQPKVKFSGTVARIAALGVLPYVRKIHGEKAIKPILKFAGVPEAILGIHAGKECSPEKCK